MLSCVAVPFYEREKEEPARAVKSRQFDSRLVKLGLESTYRRMFGKIVA